MAVPAIKQHEVLMDGVKVSQSGSIFEMSVDRSELGTPDSLRYTVLSYVLDERYDAAVEELRGFVDGPSEYPNFKDKIERFISHSVDLVYAIKAKRSFPGVSSLTRAKQQELREKFKGHFRELIQTLKVIEKIETDLRIKDVRSTIYVVKAAWYAVVGIVGMAFFLEMKAGFFREVVSSMGMLASDAADYLTRLVGL